MSASTASKARAFPCISETTAIRIFNNSFSSHHRNGVDVVDFWQNAIPLEVGYRRADQLTVRQHREQFIFRLKESFDHAAPPRDFESAGGQRPGLPPIL